MNDKFTQFDYLLNAFEEASQSPKPHLMGYKGKRDALYAHVRDLERRATPTPPVEPVKEADVSDAVTLKALRCAVVALAHAANRSPNNSIYDKAYEEVDAAIRALRGRTA